ncbi:hypothetical protein [Streptomyces coelicoflavus]|uniref:hypothetical protein n=1 Tax=Streptomyces coelicoflavus TaxID=285562 RepID=UPI00362C7B51
MNRLVKARRPGAVGRVRLRRPAVPEATVPGGASPHGVVAGGPARAPVVQYLAGRPAAPASHRKEAPAP